MEFHFPCFEIWMWNTADVARIFLGNHPIELGIPSVIPGQHSQWQFSPNDGVHTSIAISCDFTPRRCSKTVPSSTYSLNMTWFYEKPHPDWRRHAVQRLLRFTCVTLPEHWFPLWCQGRRLGGSTPTKHAYKNCVKSEAFNNIQHFARGCVWCFLLVFDSFCC